MEHLKYLQNQLEKVEKEYRTRIEERGNASPESIGGIINRTNSLKEERDRLLEDIKEEKAKIKTPDEVHIFCYVLVSTKEKVRNNLKELGDVCACLFEEDDRYHDTDCRKWRPFKAEAYISNIVQELKKEYPFKVYYLDGDLQEGDWLQIDANLKETVAIIDLLSLNRQNRDIAIRLDKPQVQIVMPLCRKLPEKVCDFAQQKEKDTFKVADAYAEKLSYSDFYFSDLPGLSNFRKKLKLIFRRKFPIKNQSTAESSIRGLSMNFQ